MRGMDTHGTGCTYSSSVAANLALGKSLSAAVRGSLKKYITQTIGQHLRWGRTHALEHFPKA